MQFFKRCFRVVAMSVLTLSVWLVGPLMVDGSAFAQQTRVYVDVTNGLATPTGLTPGDAWNNAYKYLQDGLTRAANLNPTLTNQIEVWVAKGTYFPDEDASNPAPSGDDDPTRSFQLLNFVRLYGGFAGTETTLTQRRPLSVSTARF